MNTEHIRNIDPNDDSTWKGKIFLTIDIDWASDLILKNVIDLVNKLGLKVTWFVTHKTKV